ncbi:MAG TPA: ribbon-helix-helix domain-containing protein [Candidatus Dormibacteraeota bacterium]|jgi:Arc/MetJ-type ribon-helix-helix transcriptional regulator
MTVQIAVRLPDELIADLDRIVEGGRFANRTDAVRSALERLLDDAREAELDDAIVAGYRRVPDEEPEPWVEAATRALVVDEPW